MTKRLQPFWQRMTANVRFDFMSLTVSQERETLFVRMVAPRHYRVSLRLVAQMLV